MYCENRVLDGLASGEKGSKGRNKLDCIRGKGARDRGLEVVLVSLGANPQEPK